MGVILAATDALNWLSGSSGEDAARADRRAGRRCSAPGQTLFLPYLGGERTPHNDAAHPRRVPRAGPCDRPRRG